MSVACDEPANPSPPRPTADRGVTWDNHYLGYFTSFLTASLYQKTDFLRSFIVASSVLLESVFYFNLTVEFSCVVEVLDI